MRILVLCHEYPPVGGGAAAACAALARRLTARGDELVAVTMGYADLPARASVDGLTLIRVPCGRKRKEMASPLEGLRWARRAWPVVRDLHAERPFDLTHAHFIMPAGIVADRLRGRRGVPFAITPHGSDVPGYNRERLKLAHVVVRPWWRRIVRHASALVSPSRSLLAMIEASAREPRGVVIPYAFEPRRFAVLDKRPRILLCSRLVERKGFHVFLRAIADLDLPGWGIDLVGDGPERERLEALAKRCRTPVTCHGWIDNDDPRLAELYGHAAIFAFPSEWENFPVTLLEGMSAGCAVITTNVSGNPEVIGDTGRLVPPNDESALRDAVVELTSDPDLRAALGRRAVARVNGELDGARIAERYSELFAEITR